MAVDLQGFLSMLQAPVFGTVSGNPSFVISLLSAQERASDQISGGLIARDEPVPQQSAVKASSIKPDADDRKPPKASSKESNAVPDNQALGQPLNGYASVSAGHLPPEHSKLDIVKEMADNKAAQPSYESKLPQVCLTPFGSLAFDRPAITKLQLFQHSLGANLLLLLALFVQGRQCHLLR